MINDNAAQQVLRILLYDSSHVISTSYKILSGLSRNMRALVKRKKGPPLTTRWTFRKSTSRKKVITVIVKPSKNLRAPLKRADSSKLSVWMQYYKVLYGQWPEERVRLRWSVFNFTVLTSPTNFELNWKKDPNPQFSSYKLFYHLDRFFTHASCGNAITTYWSPWLEI